jgi:uncharacterized phage infection (PIP) family protein YhgE
VIRRTIGLVAAMAGVVGVGLSVYCGIHTWLLADQLQRTTSEALVQVQSVVDTLHTQSETAVDLLGTTRERLDGIAVTLGDLSGRQVVQQQQARSLLQILDRDVISGLSRAEEFIRSMQANMSEASSALLLLDSIPFFAASMPTGVGRREGQLRSLAEGLAEISAMLDQLSQILSEIRAQSSISSSQLERLRSGLAQVDERMEHYEAEIRRFSDGVAGIQESLARFQERAPGQIQRTAVLVTVFFVCFGFSQISLLVNGSRLLAGRRNAVRERRTADSAAPGAAAR